MVLAEGSSGASAERIRELRHRGEQVDHAKSGDRAANVVVREQVADGRKRLHKVIAVPEGRPRDEDQQQSRFEQQGDEQQTSEQGG
jgi:hypothetical protein